MMLKSKWLSRVLNLDYFEAEIFFQTPCIHYLNEGIITNFCGKLSFQCNFILLKTNLDKYLFNNNGLLGHHLHRLPIYVDFSWKSFCHQHCLAL